MSEMSLSSLKNSHHIREFEEKRAQERRRNLLYLIVHYLKEEGYYETLSTFMSEAQLSNSFQICDNIDLSLILQDFESYYFVRFQKYPKICKKSNPEEGNVNLNIKRGSKFQLKKAVQDVSNNALKSNGKSQCQTKLPQAAVEGKKSITDGTCLSVVPLGAAANNGETCETKPERILKPLGGFGNHSTEWITMAETITKDIVLQDLNVHWSDIMGLEEAKKLLKEAVVYPIKYPELFKGLLSPWKGLLLYGPPGTGKTLLAKAVATECRTTFFNITASTIVSKWRGDSEKLVKVMFDLARYHAPSTIFLDELDALLSRRDGGHHSTEHEASRRMKTELLIQLDGLSKSDDQVFFLATSNLPWELDPAILRRLEKRILVDVPSQEARESMFRHYLPEVVLNQPLLKSNIYYEFLAKETEGYSGSDIRLVCKETAMQAIRKIFQVLESKGSDANVSKLDLQTITTGNVQTALDRTKPSASHLTQRYKTWQDQFGST
ncbi:hypothetical protein RUM44_005859 [Polyplax serrata]|uniref:Katanin p60 ATPase-containing subunit A-like 2 n=1 Tax=Polyplax serrata TaxID=468196 RepID=A0ABR1AYA1_POLSC